MRLYKTYKEKGFLVVGLNWVDKSSEQKKAARLYASGHGGRFPQVTERAVTTYFGVTQYPTFYLIKDGKVIFVEVGHIHDTIARMEQTIVAALK